MSEHPGPNHPAIRTGQGTMRHKVSEQADVPLRPCAAASAIASSTTHTRYGELFTLCPGLHCEPRKPLRDSAGGFGPVTCHVLSFLALDIWMSRPCPDSQLHSVAFRPCMACCKKGEAGTAESELHPVSAERWGGPHSPDSSRASLGPFRLQSLLHSVTGILALLSPSAPVPSGSAASALGATRSISAHKWSGPRPHTRGVSLSQAGWSESRDLLTQSCPTPAVWTERPVGNKREKMKR